MPLEANMPVAPITLEGTLVRLEPLSMDHFPALSAIAFNPQIWRWMSDRMQSEDDLRRYIQAGVDSAAVGTAMPWATRSRKDDRIIGSTRFAEYAGEPTRQVRGRMPPRR